MVFFDFGGIAEKSIRKQLVCKVESTRSRLAHPSIRAHTVSSTSFDARVLTLGSRTSEIAVARSMNPSSSGSKEGFIVFSSKGRSDLCSSGTR